MGDDNDCLHKRIYNCLPKVLSEFFWDYADDALGEPRCPKVFKSGQQPRTNP